jgi:ATP-dependent RNA helicase DHX37/DHR1
LRKYSIIIIDEAHERTTDTDILIGMMSRIIKLREELSREDSSIKPLKLVIMSATLRVEDFTANRNLFTTVPPVVKAEGRQHPVTVHWTRRTEVDYMEEVYKKVCKAHRKLPPGGILVFLTGQGEINELAKRLRETFPCTKESQASSGGPEVRVSGTEAPLETEDIDLNTSVNNATPEDDASHSDSESDPNSDTEFNVDDDSNTTKPTTASSSTIHLLPLYSLLPTSQQLLVFQAPPLNSRPIILATNVAETSLTIPNIRYVIDTGRAKSRLYDPDTSIQSFSVTWISKASAAQRMGRAGRTGPGHCWRLYSSAVFERDFEEYGTPEILRTPVEGLVLALNALGVKGLVEKFPFPTAPDRTRLVQAQKVCLTHPLLLFPYHPSLFQVSLRRPSGGHCVGIHFPYLLEQC